MKKILVAFLAAILLSTSCNWTGISVNADAQENTDSLEESEETTTDKTSGQCGYSAYWKLEDDGTLTISGSGNLYLTSIPWKNNGKWESGYGIEKVVIEEGITAIPDQSFSECFFLKSVSIPETLTSIPQYCFDDCRALESVELPQNLTAIQALAFDGCESLKTIVIPDKISLIGWSAFANCSSLTEVEFKSDLTVIEQGLFQGCKKLTTVSLPDTIQEVSRSAFENCSSLSYMYFPDSLEKIDEKAFNKCTALTSVNLPVSLKTVGTSAFSYCSNLKSVIFRGSERQFRLVDISSDNDAITQNPKTYEYTKMTGISLPEQLEIPASSGTVADLTAVVSPENATDPYITWSISDPDVVSFAQTEENDNGSGKTAHLLGLKKGTSVVTAAASDGSCAASCTVTVESAGEYVRVFFSGADTSAQMVKKNGTATRPSDPAKDGYAFLGWSTNPNASSGDYDFDTKVTENLTLYAIWSKDSVDTFNLGFDPNNGTDNWTLYNVKETDKVDEPDTPKKKHYTFKGWIMANEFGEWGAFDFSKSIQENILNAQRTNGMYGVGMYLKGAWEGNPVTLTYHLNGVGEKDVLTTRTIKFGDKLYTNIYPSVSGYAFLGWYLDRDCTKSEVDWDSYDSDITDLDLYAGWLKFADYPVLIYTYF